MAQFMMENGSMMSGAARESTRQKMDKYTMAPGRTICEMVMVNAPLTKRPMRVIGKTI
jgi:hypothetical protein